MKYIPPSETRPNEIGDHQLYGRSKPWKLVRGGLPVTLGTYNFVVILVAIMACIYNFRTFSIFACQANGYEPDRYVANCNASGYGEYEHGAFWFGLEPSALTFVSKANVVFLGNSRTQFAFSTATTDDWFSSASISFYLLGFLEDEDAIFFKELLPKLRLQATVYVINLDGFFNHYESPAAKTVMNDNSARSRYEGKAFWQIFHKAICTRVGRICGDRYVIFRSRRTGTYAYDAKNTARFFPGHPEPVYYDQNFDRSEVAEDLPSAVAFLSNLPVKHECVILTMVPYAGTKSGFVNALAGDLGMTVIAPHLDGLQTFDGSHLIYESAERWSKAFLEASAMQIRRCVDASLASP